MNAVATVPSISPDLVRFVLGRLTTTLGEAERMSDLLVDWRGDEVADRLRDLADACMLTGAPLQHGEIAGEVEALVEGTGRDAADFRGPCGSRRAVADALRAVTARRHPGTGELLDRGLRDWQETSAGRSGFALDHRYIDEITAGYTQRWWSPAGNRMTGGTLGVVVGPSSGGKTALLNAAAASGAASGTPVMVYQIEIAHASQIKDMAAMAALLDRSAAWRPEHEAALREAGQMLVRHVQFPRGSLDALAAPAMMESEIRRWLASLPPRPDNASPGLVVVDYLQGLRDGKDEEYEVANRAAKRLAAIAHETKLTILAMSQMTKNAQVNFGKAIADAAIKAADDPCLFEDRISGALDDLATHAAAGGDLRRHADVVFALASIDGQRILANSKHRGHGWGPEIDGRETLLVDLHANGRWTATKGADGSSKSLADFARELALRRAERKVAGKALRSQIAATAKAGLPVIGTAPPVASATSAPAQIGHDAPTPRRRQRGRIILDETGDAP